MSFWEKDGFWIGQKAKPKFKVVSRNGGLVEPKAKAKIRPVPMCTIPKEPA